MAMFFLVCIKAVHVQLQCNSYVLLNTTGKDLS